MQHGAGLTGAAHADTLNVAIRMLNHSHVMDRIFQAHLSGAPHGYKATNTDATPELGELQFAVAETDHWFKSHAAAISAADLGESITFRFTDGDQGRMTREEMLLHVIPHGLYHPGNFRQMLKGISVVPPRDLLTKFLHIREAVLRQG